MMLREGELREGELRELLALDLPDALASNVPVTQDGDPTKQNGSSVQEGPAANAKGAGSNTGTRPVLQDYDAVVTPESIPAVAAYLRDRHGYQYLSNITAIDYIMDGVIEVMYQFYRLEGGGPQTVRVRCPRANPTIPTLTGEWPGANLQEREAFDLYGVRFPGHPYLRRVYMWDEFVGFPMRKDFPKTGDKYTHETGGE